MQNTTQEVFKGSEEVFQWLLKLGLVDYYYTLLDQGYDDLRSVLHLQESDLVQMGFTPPHRCLMLIAVNDLHGTLVERAQKGARTSWSSRVRAAKHSWAGADAPWWEAYSQTIGILGKGPEGFGRAAHGGCNSAEGNHRIGRAEHTLTAEDVDVPIGEDEEDLHTNRLVALLKGSLPAPKASEQCDSGQEEIAERVAYRRQCNSSNSSIIGWGQPSPGCSVGPAVHYPPPQPLPGGQRDSACPKDLLAIAEEKERRASRRQPCSLQEIAAQKERLAEQASHGGCNSAEGNRRIGRAEHT
eukprot:EG_transcript_21428